MSFTKYHTVYVLNEVAPAIAAAAVRTGVTRAAGSTASSKATSRANVLAREKARTIARERFREQTRRLRDEAVADYKRWTADQVTSNATTDPKQDDKKTDEKRDEKDKQRKMPSFREMITDDKKASSAWKSHGKEALKFGVKSGIAASFHGGRKVAGGAVKILQKQLA